MEKGSTLDHKEMEAQGLNWHEINCWWMLHSQQNNEYPGQIKFYWYNWYNKLSHSQIKYAFKEMLSIDSI